MNYIHVEVHTVFTVDDIKPVSYRSVFILIVIGLYQVALAHV